MSRFLRSSLVTVFMVALATGTAYAQDDDDDFGDPCGGDPCGGDPCGGDPCGGDGDGDAMPDDSGDGGGDAAMDGEGGGHPGMMLPKGAIAIHAVVEVNMSADLVAKPFSIAPDVWYGVSPKLQVGLVHSRMGQTGFLGGAGLLGAGAGLCLAGE
jgi:hypothetical protein